MSANSAAVTPMMVQFLEIKTDYPDALLFYRMGDFYELFFEDAVAAAEALDIALTKRGKLLGEEIPMCGVPHHAAEGYLLTLIRKGFRVAVCEQLESPAEAKKRGYKAIVKRGVVRLVTPGTLTEESLLNARQHNFLCAYSEVRDQSAMAWVDISTGDLNVQVCPRVTVGPMLGRLAPKEILIPDHSTQELALVFEDSNVAITPLSRASFDSNLAVDRLCNLFKVKSLDGFGIFNRAELSALGAIVDYLELTQKGQLPLLRSPTQETQTSAMQIDAATRRNLELTKTLNGERQGSLLHTIDRTITGPGSRLLETRLANPSTRPETLNLRLDSVSFFANDQVMKDKIRSCLRTTADMDRALTRLSLDRGGPRDMVSIRTSLGQAEALCADLAALELSEELTTARMKLTGHFDLIEALTSALKDTPPLLMRDGGFIATGYSAALDEARALRDDGRNVVSGLQSQYADITNINTLKIKHNNVLGYFIETPASHGQKMMAQPMSETFIHRQTLANVVRFTTVELSALENKILNAGGHALELEKEIYSFLREDILDCAEQISGAAKALAIFDLSTALADLALAENWVRPTLTKDLQLNIIGGRHPVVEATLKSDGSTSFVANDCCLSRDHGSKPVWLLTGPNMAGKSTFLRQNAIIAILAQIGSYVPATSATIGVVTQLFSRVGASDDLARGRSTFMVEMVETAAILNRADQGALVILDEIGRGTATYDGLSIAWATLEHLHEVNKCRTLFATHYHELTGLPSKLDGLLNATVSVREWEGDIIFLHEVRTGAADRSYGVQVARLAGLPPTVINRAKVVLESLEKNDRQNKNKTSALLDDLPLFSASVDSSSPLTPPKTPAVLTKLKEVHPDELTPKDALALLYELKSLSEN